MRTEKEKKAFHSRLSKASDRQRIGITLKLEITDVLCDRLSLLVQGQTRSFIDVLYSTLSLKTRSFTF